MPKGKYIRTKSLARPITYKENWSLAKKVGLDTPCHECTSHFIDKNGYAIVSHSGKHAIASRYVYEKEYGELLKEIKVRHKCDNPSCINLLHLEPGTMAENTNDSLTRGRFRVKLKEDEIRFILANPETNNTELGKKFNVHRTSIANVRSGKRRRIILDKLKYTA